MYAYVIKNLTHLYVKKVKLYSLFILKLFIFNLFVITKLFSFSIRLQLNLIN